MPLIEVSGVYAGYGGADILKGVSLSLDKGQIGVIVGPNGAGKSTCLKAIFGLLSVSQGNISFNGRDITNLAPETLAQRGMAFVPQEENIFPNLSVEENLQMGAFIRRDDYADTLENVYGFFPPLRAKSRQMAGELSGGQRQMVAMGRALMLEPGVLLLDEPTAGLSPLYRSEIFARIRTINASGVGVLMVEQNAKQALSIAHCGFVLSSGVNRFQGSGKELLADPDVARSFLGG